MKTDIKNFPRGLDEKDLLYLIWKRLGEMGGGSSDGGSDSSDSDSDSGSGCECLAPMIVSGTIDESGEFTPGEGAPTWEEAQEQMFNGGLVYLVGIFDGEPVVVFLATKADPEAIGAPTDTVFVHWFKSSDDSIDDPGNETIG